MNDVIIKENGVLIATGKSKKPIHSLKDLCVTHIVIKNNLSFAIGHTYMVGNKEFLFSRICTSAAQQASKVTFAMC